MYDCFCLFPLQCADFNRRYRRSCLHCTEVTEQKKSTRHAFDASARLLFNSRESIQFI